MRQYGKRIPGAAIVIVTDKQNKPVTPVAGFSQAVRAKAHGSAWQQERNGQNLWKNIIRKY
ncbi:hypothetical protein DXB25_09440 [Lachnospiraceae bacterium OM02-31]|nr:hypothetical protein DXB25_09440 [Lachnospiraceae bacterium OM02-31]RJW56304.1 hypothetical protein DXB24_16055 [Lachnospiraceae bacterium OM02-3]